MCGKCHTSIGQTCCWQFKNFLWYQSLGYGMCRVCLSDGLFLENVFAQKRLGITLCIICSWDLSQTLHRHFILNINCCKNVILLMKIKYSNKSFKFNTSFSLNIYCFRPNKCKTFYLLSYADKFTKYTFFPLHWSTKFDTFDGRILQMTQMAGKSLHMGKVHYYLCSCQSAFW